MTRVLGTGLMAIDHIWYVQGNSLKNSKPEYLGSSGGGSVGNTLCMLSLLGHKTSSFGVIGNDLAGSLL